MARYGGVVTVASAVAAVFSYFAAAKSAEVAEKAQTFVEQSAVIQDKLASPRVSITGGKIMYLGTVDPERSYEQKNDRFRIQINLKNSGDMDASPFWLAFSSNIFSSPRASQFVLPKGVDLSIEEEIEIPSRQSWRDQDVIVVLGYEDKTPHRSSKLFSANLQISCVGPIGFTLSPSEYAWRAFNRNVHRNNNEFPSELSLPPAQFLSLVDTKESPLSYDVKNVLEKVQWSMTPCRNYSPTSL